MEKSLITTNIAQIPAIEILKHTIILPAILAEFWQMSGTLDLTNFPLLINVPPEPSDDRKWGYVENAKRYDVATRRIDGIELDVTKLNAGIYLIDLMNENYRGIRKFIKE